MHEHDKTDDLHLNLFEGMYLRTGALDAQGRPTQARGRLVAPAEVERIRGKIHRCAHCRELAARLSAMHSAVAIDGMAPERSIALNWRRLAAIAAALAFAPLIAAGLALSQTGAVHAWRGLNPVAEGDQLASRPTGERILMLTGLDKAGEINLHSGSRITLTRNDAEEVEWELHGGDAEVKLSGQQPSKQFFIKVGSVRASALAAAMPEGASEAHFRIHCDTEAPSRQRRIRITVYYGTIRCCGENNAGQTVSLAEGESVEIVRDELTGKTLVARAQRPAR